MKPVDQHLHIPEPVLQDIVDQFMHLPGIFVQICQYIGEGNQEVALFENAGAHEAGDQFLAPGIHGPGFLPAGFPVPAGTDGQIRCLRKFTPAGDILHHLGLLGDVRHGPRRILREVDDRSPAVPAHGAPHPVAPQVRVDRVVHDHIQCFILPENAVRPSVLLQKFEEKFLRCHHFLSCFLSATKNYRAGGRSPGFPLSRSGCRMYR